MKYFLDTEFIEGTQKSWFGRDTKRTIDLISIGIVAEDGREYYAISKDFNLKEAWNRFQYKDSMNLSTGVIEKNKSNRKEYWIRENVLKPIWAELRAKEVEEYNIAARRNVVLDFPTYGFNFKSLKRLITKYGKSNKQIAEEICHFIDARWIEEGNISKGFMCPGGTSIKEVKTTDVQFYGYFADYDWVVFCWLFDKMIDLPKGFPMYCIDLKQILDEKLNNKILPIKGFTNEPNNSLHNKLIEIQCYSNYPKQTNEHNALADAKWNFELYKFLNIL